jgi:hypothetical protein
MVVNNGVLLRWVPEVSFTDRWPASVRATGGGGVMTGADPRKYSPRD